MSEPTPAQKAIGDFAPKLVDLTDSVLFGDVWERPQLSKRDRSLITVASLITSSSFEQLPNHLRLAKQNGLTEAELTEAIVHLAFYAGWPRAMSAIQVAKQAFPQITVETSMKDQFVIGYPDHKGVHIERVTYPNIRFETVIAANLFLPPNLDPDRKHPAILVGHPFLGVKEQTSGLHAQLLAERGYITMAFDASHYGDSTGAPRFMESPAIRVEDFSAGVDFLSNHPLVDPDRIGVLGICGGGGYSVNAAQLDHRIKAIATVSMFDLGRVRREGLDGEITYADRMKTLDAVGRERTEEATGKAPRFFNMETDQFGGGRQLGEKTAALAVDLMAYYTTDRGAHPNCPGVFTFTSLPGMFDYFPFAQIGTISPRPLLMIVGENAPSAYFSEDAYSRAAEPKELLVIPGATHADVYDRAPYLTRSLEKLTQFFTDHL